MASTTKAYEIRKVEDFLSVPTHRRALCLHEFGEWCALADLITADPSLGRLVTDVFVWHDDDLRELKLNITFERAEKAR